MKYLLNLMSASSNVSREFAENLSDNGNHQTVPSSPCLYRGLIHLCCPHIENCYLHMWPEAYNLERGDMLLIWLHYSFSRTVVPGL